MKAQRPVGLALSWQRSTTVFLIVVATLVLAGGWPEGIAWWIGVGFAALVTIVTLPTYRGITLATAVGSWLWNWSAAPEEALAVKCTPPIDHTRRFGRNAVGVREYRGLLVAAIAIDQPADRPPERHHQSVVPPTSLSVHDVARGLRQFDVCLDAIDIVSVRNRLLSDAGDGHGSNDFAPSSRGAVDRRTTWLVLRMDPQHNVAAIAVRDSVASTLAAAAERLAQDLDGRRCTARPLTSVELTEVDTAVLAGLQPTWRLPGWKQLKHFNGYATSFWVSPQDITSETLDQLWRSDTSATVMTIRIVRGECGAELSVWVRYHSGQRLGREVWGGLNRLVGRQLAAVQASMAAPSRHSPLVVPSRMLGEHEQLSIPLGPTIYRPRKRPAAIGHRDGDGPPRRVSAVAAQLQTNR